MNFLEFQTAFARFPIIPVIEIEKLFPGYDRNALTRWQKKGYIKKIRNGYYRIADLKLEGETDLFLIANKIYQPSYVSMYSALRWYDFIPEGVFTITSVSTKKTLSFNTSESLFSYQNIRKELFFGYHLEKSGDQFYKIASPEKTILDFLHLEPQYNSADDFFELRFNIWEINERINFKILDNYLDHFDSKALTNRVHIFKAYLKEYDDNK